MNDPRNILRDVLKEPFTEEEEHWPNAEELAEMLKERPKVTFGPPLLLPLPTALKPH